MRDPRHIVITGASSGIGAALALEYAAHGVRLSLHGRQSERLNSIAQQAKERGALVSTHIGDVSDAADMAEWIMNCDKETTVDLVIANAGISSGTAKGIEKADQAQTIFAVNVLGVLHTIQPILPIMIRRGRGQIALVSSLASFRGFPGAPAYCASKAAIRIYGEGLRADMMKHHVGVSVICPGFIKTPMTDLNPFRMPFLMTANSAAHLIREGLSRDHGRIAFPALMYLGIRLLAALPQPLLDFIMSRTPKKQSPTA
jgi:NADP-dependent 3-hydroxy acid dehydrogenase YdfG